MRGLFVFALALWPMLAHAAETIRVRSGEHSGFTRLTFSIPQGLEWSVESTEIRFGTEVVLETAQVFDRIGRDRLLGIAGLPRGAVLTLGCDCRLSAFLQGSTLLVVDIAPAPADQVESQVQLPTLRSDQPTAVDTSLALPLLPKVPVAPPAPPETATGQTSLADLPYALNRAATLGLVVADVPPDQSLSDLAREFPLASGQMRAMASTDLEVIETGGKASATVCPDPKTLPDLSSVKWEQFVDLRTKVTLPTGKSDSQAIRALAEAYLSLGFGAEAQALLAQLDVTPDDLPAHIALAEWFEGQSQQPFFTPDLLQCPPDVAFWSFLQTPSAPQADSVDLLALVEHFLTMPDPIQGLFGADFAMALLNRDRDDLALIVQRGRGGYSGDDEEGLIVQAEAAARQHEFTKADGLLAQAITLDGPQAPQALHRKIQLALAEGQDVSAGDIEQARALVAELGDTPWGQDLAGTMLEAMVAAGDLHGALRSTVDGPDQVLAWGLKYLSDTDMAWAAAYYTQAQGRQLTDETFAGLAAVLGRLGFPAASAEPAPPVRVASVAQSQAWSEVSNLPVSVPMAEALLLDTTAAVPALSQLVRQAQVLP